MGDNKVLEAFTRATSGIVPVNTCRIAMERTNLCSLMLFPASRAKREQWVAFIQRARAHLQHYLTFRLRSHELTGAVARAQRHRAPGDSVKSPSDICVVQSPEICAELAYTIDQEQGDGASIYC